MNGSPSQMVEFHQKYNNINRLVTKRYVEIHDVSVSMGINAVVTLITKSCRGARTKFK